MRYSFLFNFFRLITLLDFLVFYFHNIQYLAFIVSLPLRMFFFIDLLEMFYGSFGSRVNLQNKKSGFFEIYFNLFTFQFP